MSKSNNNSSVKGRAYLSIATIIVVLLIDQTVKIAIKTNFMLGDEIRVFGDWFRLHFVENNGMAFGMELAGHWSKLALTSFRIIAVGGIGYYLIRLCKRKSYVSKMLILCTSLVWAGAVGNIIDSVFYGVIFNSSFGQVASIFPDGGGYSSWLHGRVVDMLYLPIIESQWPSWMPFIGGNELIFFRPVFNVADAAISVGIVLLLIFCRKDMSEEFGEDKATK